MLLDKCFIIAELSANHGGDIEIASARPSARNESPVTATIFHQSLPNLYSMYTSLKNFIILSFI